MRYSACSWRHLDRGPLHSASLPTCLGWLGGPQVAGTCGLPSPSGSMSAWSDKGSEIRRASGNVRETRRLLDVYWTCLLELLQHPVSTSSRLHLCRDRCC